MKLETGGPRRAVAMRLGVDASGQSADGDAASITWGPDLVELEQRETDIWYRAHMDLTAITEELSIWIAAEQGEGFDEFRVSVDDVSLRKR